MDLRKIKKLIELFEQSQLIKMEISEGDSTIRLHRAGGVAVSAVTTTTSSPAPAVRHAAEPESDNGMAAGGEEMQSPMVGTFYDAPSPDAAPYVEIGDQVKVGDVLCVIEAMKTFNQIQSEKAGTIIEILKASGDPVEFGEPLFIIGQVPGPAS